MNRTTTLSLGTILLLFAGEATAQSTSLLVDVFSPAPPITTLDVVTLRALTPIDVFPDSSHQITSTFLVNGFNINWNISSVDVIGIGLQVLLPMGTQNSLGPLAAGTYNVQAQWNHLGPGLLVGAPTSGNGSTKFTVVPEPSARFLMTVGFVMTAALCRRSRRPN